ncbi:hypothetical protein [Streptomyces sp. NPDC050759]|uniref:hypothetical protein n=1 Tax=Streptomyces sp. NPDC050759 TaxID=3365635 RepID=UPI003793FFE7
MTSTTPAVRTAGTDVSALLVEARREGDSIANRGIVSAPRAVADILTTPKELAPTMSTPAPSPQRSTTGNTPSSTS